MARRELQEINAGSMADIAFLLLIFWLVTTTIDSDEGIKRQLPPPVPPDIDVPQAKEQNVFNVKVNFLDQLLVEGEPLDLEQLKDKAKNFLIATGAELALTYNDRSPLESMHTSEFFRLMRVRPELAAFGQLESKEQVYFYRGATGPLDRPQTDHILTHPCTPFHALTHPALPDP